MKYKAILFDMDGTLLPMDIDKFTMCYFKALCKAVCPGKMEPKAFTDAVWQSTAEMMKNDGSALNREVFWQTFEKITEIDNVKEYKELCDEFYEEKFNEIRLICGENPLAVKAVKLANEKADIVVLATSPIFPETAQLNRLGWMGLKKEDFRLVTSYDTDSYCKPNPDYYKSICERIGVLPSECLMIGNDVNEDMKPTLAVGMDTYLVTDWLIPAKDYTYNGKSGAFEELIDFLKSV